MANILVVDDQACVRELFSQELTFEGHTVTSVGNAESVKRHMESSRPDLVLLDLYMDELDGWHVLLEIKKQDPYLPVLIVTAYDSYPDDPRLSQAEGYVVKSINLDELKQKVDDILSRRVVRQTNPESKPSILQSAEAH